jgi:hypothetical protein
VGTKRHGGSDGGGFCLSALASDAARSLSLGALTRCTVAPLANAAPIEIE